MILSIAFLIPAADVIAGRTVFATLCDTQAGVKVFRRASVDPEWLGSYGELKWQRVIGKTQRKLANRHMKSISLERVMPWPEINKFQVAIQDLTNNEVRGALTNFHYWGGWLIHTLPGQHTADSCPQVPNESAFERSVFEFSK